MPVVVCPECGRKLQLPDAALAREARCPLCGSGFVAESDGETGRGVTVRQLREQAPPEELPIARPIARKQASPDDHDTRPRGFSSGTKWILLLAGVGLLAATGLIGYVVYQKFGPSNKSRIVGKWKVVEGTWPMEDVEVVFEFTSNGKLRIKYADNSRSEMSYRLNGDTLEITRTDEFNAVEKGDNIPARIITLTDKELVYESSVSKERTRFKRIE